MFDDANATIHIYSHKNRNIIGSADNNTNIPVHCKKIHERNGRISDSLSAKYTQHEFTDSSQSFPACVQYLWAMLHNANNHIAQNSIYPAYGTYHWLGSINAHTFGKPSIHRKKLTEYDDTAF